MRGLTSSAAWAGRLRCALSSSMGEHMCLSLEMELGLALTLALALALGLDGVPQFWGGAAAAVRSLLVGRPVGGLWPDTGAGGAGSGSRGGVPVVLDWLPAEGAAGPSSLGGASPPRGCGCNSSHSQDCWRVRNRKRGNKKTFTFQKMYEII